MRRSLSGPICACLAVAVVLAAPPAQDRPVSGDAIIQQMISEVSADRIAGTLDQFVNVSTRFSPTWGCQMVGAAIFKYLARLPLPVDYDAFKYSSRIAGPMPGGRNVIATLRGVESPERVVVLGAHYDSFAVENPWRFAPGADDNASGVAAVLEIARVLSSRSFNLTIKVVAFDAEELGCYGSEHVAAQARARREQFVAVLNLDMVGYDGGGKRGLAVVTDRNSEWLADHLLAAAGKYHVTVTMAKRMNASWARGDQEKFWAAGYPAIDEIEDTPEFNPYYHTQRDTVDRLNMQFLAAVTRVTLATVAELADPLPGRRTAADGPGAKR